MDLTPLTAVSPIDGRYAGKTADLPLFAVGFVTSFFSALLVVKLFVRYVSHHSFAAFAWYRIIFGALLLGYYYSQSTGPVTG